MENKWIILMAISNHLEPAWMSHDGNPRLWDTEKEAQIYLAENYHDTLAHQINEFKEGHREFDEIDLECDEWVSSCTVDENGCISIPIDGEIYNPKTFVR